MISVKAEEWFMVASHFWKGRHLNVWIESDICVFQCVRDGDLYFILWNT